MRSQLEALIGEMVESGILFEDAVSEFEKIFILQVLSKHRGNVSKAADELQIHRNTLSKRLDEYLPPPLPPPKPAARNRHTPKKD